MDMKLSKFKIMIIATVFLMAAFLPMMQLGEAEGLETRADAIASGHVTADDTWSGEFWTDDITIDPDVTITVAAGSTWYVPALNFIEVEGTLIIAGTEALPVSVEELNSGMGWDSIEVLRDGVAHFENFTMDDGFIPIRLEGGPCVIKNAAINGERNAIYSRSDGGHELDNLDLTAVGGDSGILLQKNTVQTEMNQITIDNSQAGVILDECININMHGLYITKVATGFFLADSSGITISTCSVQGTGSADTAGFLFRGLTSDISAVGCSASKVEFGVYFVTTEGSYVEFEGLYLRTDIGVSNNDPADHIDANFTDCDFDDVGDNAALIDSTSDTVYINFINTTWDGAAPIKATGESELIVSWHADIHVGDGNGDPLDCDVRLDTSSGHTLYDEASPDGFADEVIVPSISFTDGSSPNLRNDLIITSNDGLETQIFPRVDWWVDSYEELFLTMDLWPTNNLSAVLEVDEDEWLNLDLNDNFTDPEGQDLYFEFMASPELQVNQVGGHGSGTLKIRGAEDNWFGDGWLYVNATDASGNMTEANVTVRVLSVNDKPFLVTPPLPELEVEEDSSVYINFTGMADDVESDVTWAADDVDNCVLAWDESHINLTVTPDENWFGMLEIPLNISDGEDWLHETLFVNVTPVNDMPEVAFMWPNGTEVEMVEYVWNETVNITVYEITTVEDTPVAFWINATDIEVAELIYYFDEGAVMHGAVEVETFEYLNETNVTVTEIVPMNFSYTPDQDDFAGDLVMFNVSDGEADLGFWVWFNVAGVNDRPTFDAPTGWNVTVELDNLTVIDIAGMIGDVDGDDLTVTVDSDYVTVNGTQLEILYNDTFDADWQNVTVTVSDGTLGATAVFLINIDRSAVADDDDDDDEPALGTLEVTPEEDGWLFEVTGDEGQTLYVVIEDADGELTSYPMTYADGKYSVKIDAEDAEAGLSYYLSDEENGGSLGAGTAGTLTDLAEADEDDDPFPLWILLLVAIIVIILIILIAVAMSRGKGEEEYDEE